MEDAKIVSFKYTDVQESSLREIKEKSTGSFTFTASFKWIEKERFIEKKADSTKIRLRQDIVLDRNKDFFPISIWGDLIDELTENTVYQFSSITVKYGGII